MHMEDVWDAGARSSLGNGRQALSCSSGMGSSCLLGVIYSRGHLDLGDNVVPYPGDLAH